MYSNPTGGGKDSLFPHPTGGGKDSLCTVSYCIYPRPSPKENEPNSGKQAKIFPANMEDFRRTPFNPKPYREGYKLPFRERPKLSRIPCITSGFADFNKQSALSTAIQDLLHKGAIDIVQKPDSVGFYSHLFLVPKPGNRWRPVIDLSCLNQFLAISKFKMETPESI